MGSTITIDGRTIGASHRPYIIAEMSANHGGNIERGRRIVRLAANCGADAIKLQAYSADDLTIQSSHSDFFLNSGEWAGQTLYSLYQSAATPYEWLDILFAEAKDAGITAFATPFSAAAAEHMAGLGAPAYKVASFEAIDLELIRCVAEKGKPVIISTGLCTEEEVGLAIETAKSAGATEVAILKCTSAYPADPENLNLLTIKDMCDRFDVPVGFSDHSLGNAAAIAAVALGATLVEKHFIDTKEPPTADSTFSCLPEDLADLRQDLDIAWKARGTIAYGVSDAEKASLAYRRSLYVIKPINKGERIERTNIRSIRPGYGISPVDLHRVLTMRATRDLHPGDRLDWDALTAD